MSDIEFIDWENNTSAIFNCPEYTEEYGITGDGELVKVFKFKVSSEYDRSIIVRTKVDFNAENSPELDYPYYADEDKDEQYS